MTPAVGERRGAEGALPVGHSGSTERSLGHLELRRGHEEQALKPVLPPQSAQGYKCVKGHGTFRKNERLTLVKAKGVSR